MLPIYTTSTDKQSKFKSGWVHRLLTVRSQNSMLVPPHCDPGVSAPWRNIPFSHIIPTLIKPGISFFLLKPSPNNMYQLSKAHGATSSVNRTQAESNQWAKNGYLLSSLNLSITRIVQQRRNIYHKLNFTCLIQEAKKNSKPSTIVSVLLLRKIRFQTLKCIPILFLC